MKKLIAFTLVSLTFITQAQVQCIAHRGLHGDGILPNTFDAIKAAYNAEMEGIEFDIRHTKDGYGLLAHNPNLNEFINKDANSNCDPEALIAETTAEEIRLNCKQVDGKEVEFFSKVADFLEEMNGYTTTFPALFIELKDAFVSERTIDNLRRVIDIYPNEKLRFISFEETVINQIAQVDSIDHVKRLFIDVLPYKLYKKKNKDKVAADGFLFSSRGYAGKLPEYNVPEFIHKLFPKVGYPTFTLPTITDHFWRKNYLKKMDNAGLETAVWLNWSAHARSAFFSLTKYVDITKRDTCRYLKRNIDFIVTDDPKYCMELRASLPKKCMSLEKEYTTTDQIH